MAGSSAQIKAADLRSCWKPLTVGSTDCSFSGPWELALSAAIRRQSVPFAQKQKANNGQQHDYERDIFHRPGDNVALDDDFPKEVDYVEAILCTNSSA
jgi:hypothetical protein